MAYKTILSVTGVDQGDRDLKLAAELCGQVDAHLSALVVAIAAPPPMGDAVLMADVWAKERQAVMDRVTERASAVSAFLAKNELRGDVSSEYPDIAWVDEAVGQRARYADLTVIGPEILKTETLKSKIVEGVLFSSGKPLLLAPEGSHATLKPKRVVVAWDSSFEASRALRESLDMLDDAEVRITLVDPIADDLGQGAEPGTDVAAYLVRRGIKVDVDRLPSSGRSVAEVLTRHAGDMSADLLVMGAYGHSRLRERLFGGVTKSILAAPPLPILLAR
ncbi:universal stress protein [Mesorhizobium sp. 1B3]|uniref:universal stress protein n=1 Tax=Mesorhizobium sp. 1B3 TaxID=3243599 RepID=UPI003D99528C